MPTTATTTTAKPAKRVRKPAPVAAFDPALDEYFRDPAILDLYHHRTIGGVEDFEILNSYRTRTESGVLKPKHLLLEGPTSSGKTFAIEALAASAQVPLFTISGAGGTSERDLFGGYVPHIDADGKEQLVWADGPVTLAAKFGGILYVNEANFIPAEVSALLLSLTDFRGRVVVRGAAKRVELNDGAVEYRELVLTVHPTLWVVIDGNPGYTGTGDLNQAFRNRFSVCEWGYDPEVEEHLIASPALRNLIAALRVLSASDLYTPIATKQFVDFEANVYELGWDYAVHSLLSYFHESERQVVSTTLNDGYATKICLDYGIEFVDADDIDDDES